MHWTTTGLLTSGVLLVISFFIYLYFLNKDYTRNMETDEAEGRWNKFNS